MEALNLFGWLIDIWIANSEQCIYNCIIELREEKKQNIFKNNRPNYANKIF